jgi:hypothetical protein
MITLTKGEELNVYFTGTENCLLVSPYFLFVFTNRVTKEEVKFVSTNQNNTARCDFIELTVNDFFADSETGFWTYNIYEQEDPADTTITGKHKVESGLMYLHPADTYEPIEYNEQDNSFKTYNG